MVILKGKNITLRPLRLSDAKDIYKNVNNYKICKWIVNLCWPYKLKHAIKFIKKKEQKYNPFRNCG